MKPPAAPASEPRTTCGDVGTSTVGTALVTGAAGSIGSAVCARLLRDGFRVIGWDASDDFKTDLIEAGVEAHRVDHTDPAAVTAAAALLPDRVDHLFLIAGGALRPEVDAERAGDLPDPDLFATSLETNLIGVYRTIYATANHLPTGGSITVTSSINTAGSYGMPGYTSAKAGLHGMVITLAKLLGRRGVRINAIALGTVRTPRTEALYAHDPHHFDRLNDGAALPSITDVAAAADAFVTVAHDLRSTTGTVLTIDAGQSILRGA